MTSTDRGAPVSDVVVLYGVPPAMDLVNGSRRKLGRAFELTPWNQGSFELALRSALGRFLGEHANLAGARMILIKNAADLIAAVKARRPRRLIYYGHAIADTQVLLPSLGKSITAWQLTNVLKGSGVQDFDILGCNGSSIAAELVGEVKGIRIGYLLNKRYDNIETDAKGLRVKRLELDPQRIRHYFTPAEP